MGVRLVSVAGPRQGTKIPIDSDLVSIGRGPSNQIHIEDRLVSRHHCVNTT
jgi:pSer/pThr/pTyr-binding forkhead associated (FHA) protein